MICVLLSIINRCLRQFIFTAICTVVSVLSFAKSVSGATTYYWTNSTGGGANYSVNANWSPNTVPADNNSYAWITNGGTVNFNGSYTNGQLYIATVNNSAGTFNMTGGTLW